jgi:hypothetical protein
MTDHGETQGMLSGESGGMDNPTRASDDGSDFQITRFTPGPNLTQLLADRGDPAPVLVLPRTIEGDLGVYRESDLITVKTLRHQDVPIDFRHPAPRRTFQGEYSAEIVVFLTIFIAEALGEQVVQDLVRHLWKSFRAATTFGANSPPQLTVEISKFVAHGDRRELEGVRISGQDAEQVVNAVEQALRTELPPGEDD